MPQPPMKSYPLALVALAVLVASCGAPSPSPTGGRGAIDAVDTVVVNCAENRDIDGAVLPVLSPVWGGLTAPGQAQVVTQAQTAVDKTPYDTASILRFITRRWNLEPLPGLDLRDRSLVAHGFAAMGDLGNALEARP
jgi:hypothetical protein